MPSFCKGEIIFEDEPYATAVLEDRMGDTCNWCFAHDFPDPLICVTCTGVVYCSERCREKDSEYHSLECLFLMCETEDESDTGIQRFTLRTLVRVLAEMESNSPSVRFFFEHQCTFKDLVTHADRIEGPQMENFLDTSEQILEFLSEQGKEVSSDLILEIVLKLFINGHCAKNSSYLNSVQLGHVLYLAGSKTNHSCVFQEDYIQLFKGNRTILKALKDFSVSDSLKLETQYIPLQFSYKLRQEFLKKRYFFTCECPRCVEESAHPPPQFLAEIENFLLQPVTSETLETLQSMQARFKRFPNTNFYKNMLLTRLFLEGNRETIEKSQSLGTAALEGCRFLTDRMKILYIICSDLARFGANDSSHEYHEKFKHFHGMALTVFTDVHGKDHPLTEEIADMALPKAAGEKKSSRVAAGVDKSTPVVLDAV